MNITFFTENMGMGGAQRVISILSNHFCKDNNVSIVLTDSDSTSAYRLDKSIKLTNYKSWCNSSPVLLKNLRFFSYKIKSRLNRKKTDIFEEYLNYKLKADNLRYYIKKNPTDILISFLVKPNIIVGLCSRNINAKIVMAERNYPARPEFESYFIELRNACYRKANICVFQTKEQAEMFPSNILKKSVIIPNPIKSNLPAPLPFINRKKVIVNYCGFKEHKNIILLLEAYSIVEKKYPEFFLELYGYGDSSSIIKKITELHLESKVKIQPFKSDIHSIVKSYYMFVMSSDFEGMPNALIEAMAIGLPVISTDCLGGGAKSVIKNGKNGFLVPTNDKLALSDAMINLIENPEIASAFVTNALKIKEDLDSNKIAENWSSVVFNEVNR